MRIAIAADREQINRNFLDSKWFRLYDVEGQTVTQELKVPTLGVGQEELIRALSEYRADVLICGVLSGKTRAALSEAGILTFGGIIGKPENAIAALLAGTLTPQNGEACAAEECSHGCSEESCKNCQFKN